MNVDKFLVGMAVRSVMEPAINSSRSCSSGAGSPTVLGPDDSPIGDLSVGLGALVMLRSLDLGHNLLDGKKHPLTALGSRFSLMRGCVVAVFCSCPNIPI